VRKITLSKSGLNKLRSHQKELKISDVEDSLKSFAPGEWCWLVSGQDHWVAFVNPLIEDKFASIMVLEYVPANQLTSFSAENLISLKISTAFKKRLNFKGYQKGSRLFYGASDGLPGLIVDKFLNAAVIQINTAGLDRHRDLIKNLFEYMLNIKCYFLDHAKYREKEGLPVFEVEALPNLEIEENEIRYHLRSEVIQKVGFYYDHRENRKLMADLLLRLDTMPSLGLDLFSYAGAWGLNALKAGVREVDFVDQGNFERELQECLALNELSGRGKFFRADVFKFLDEKISQKKAYDLIMSDPPAFAKSSGQKDQALDGYTKLHRKVFKLAAPGAVCVFSSCTHYVGHEEFQKNVLDAANKENKKIQLLSCGMQGWDHPVSSLSERSNYIKSYIYILES
jgi:23S rRNA (cytosine1962-C5)-methyltransferase